MANPSKETRAYANKKAYIRERNKEVYAQLNLRIPSDLSDRLKEAADRRGVSQRAFVIEAIEEKLDRIF